MAYYSALVANVQTGSAAYRYDTPWSTGSGWGLNPANAGGQNSYTRVSPIVSPHFVVQDPGGFISADFAVPADVAGSVQAHLRFGAWCWIYDGRTPIFYGKINVQPRPDAGGMIAVNLIGWWQLLHTTRFREAWDDPDMSKWVPCELNDHNPTVEITSGGRLRIMWPNGTAIAVGNRAQVDYLLFNEEAGARDNKCITAFDVSCSNDNALGATINFRLYGRQNIDSGVEDQLVGITTAAGSFTRKQGQVANSWPDAAGNGYRIIRLGMQGVAANTIAADRFLTFDRLRIGTRETLLTTFGSPPNSSDIAADLMDNYDNHLGHVSQFFDQPPEFFRSPTPDGGAGVGLTKYGSDPVIRGVVTSGVGVDSMTFSDWTAPAEALAALSTIDGFQVGFYLPAAPQTGWWSADKVAWPFQMPQMTYKPWSNLTAPDYQVSIRRGADVQQDDSPQPLIDTLYVNYEKNAGRQFSLVVKDGVTSNYLFANGLERAEDYSVETPVSANVATSLANQVFTLRRQPLAAGLVTIYANRPGSITDGGGASVTRLSMIRPGVVQIPDLPRTSYKVGRCTQVEWWGETLDAPEQVQLTLEHPGTVSISRRLGAVGVLAQRTVRVRGGLRKRR